MNEKVATENPTWFAEADSFVGNGPFKLSEWKHDVSLHWKKMRIIGMRIHVKLDKVHWAMVDDSNTEYQMYKTGDLDVSDVPAELADQLFNDPELENEDQAGLIFLPF